MWTGDYGLYLTYEELKHYEEFKENYGQEAFISYLWGIETVLDVRQNVRNFEFISYLWGIETGMARNIQKAEA